MPFHRRTNASCFFFNDTATTEIYTLSLHDALPISYGRALRSGAAGWATERAADRHHRSEEHTSELQSRGHLVCRLLLEKKNPQPALHSPRSRPLSPPHDASRLLDL